MFLYTIPILSANNINSVKLQHNARYFRVNLFIIIKNSNPTTWNIDANMVDMDVSLILSIEPKTGHPYSIE